MPYVMLNQKGEPLPLTVPTEEYANKMIGMSPELIRVGVPDYGLEFEGDLVPATYKEIGNKASKYVEDELTKALQEILKEQTHARINEKKKESEYKLMSNKIDALASKVIGHSILLILGTLACYGLYVGLSLIFPEVIVYILTSLLAVSILFVPVAYLIGMLKLNKKEKISKTTQETKDYNAVVPYNSLAVNGMRLEPYSVLHDNYKLQRAYIYTLTHEYPAYLCADRELTENNNFIICPCCLNPTPVYKRNTKIYCINCNIEMKITKKDIFYYNPYNNDHMSEVLYNAAKVYHKMLTKLLGKNLGNYKRSSLFEYYTTPLYEQVSKYHEKLNKEIENLLKNKDASDVHDAE